MRSHASHGSCSIAMLNNQRVPFGNKTSHLKSDLNVVLTEKYLQIGDFPLPWVQGETRW